MGNEKRFFEEYLERADAAATKLKKTLGLLGENHPDEIKDRMVEALGAELQQLYTGFEELSKTLLRAQDIYIKKSEGHHQLLLQHVFARIIPPDEKLQPFWADLLAFRHFTGTLMGETCDQARS